MAPGKYPVPFIALCPYCRVGRINTPDKAFGLTAKCPHCGADFTLIPSGEKPDATPKKPAPKPVAPIGQPSAPARQPRGSDAPTYAVAAPVRTQRPPEDVDTEIVPAARTAPAAPIAQPFTGWDAEGPDDPPAVTTATIVSMFLLAFGLIASQIPYGRFGTVGAALVGLCFGLVACFTSGRLRLPVLATVFNAILLLVVVVLPGWLGLESWHPPKVGEDPKQIRVFDINGLGIPDGEWISADRGWQFDDVRVQVTNVVAWPVELTGPDAKKRWSKGKYLVVTVKVSNVGVARPLPFPKWAMSPAKPGDPVPKLTTAAGDALLPATFETGWSATPKEPPATLLPTQFGERTFLFDLPTAPTDTLRFELPAAEFGAPQPVRFQVNATQIPSSRKKDP